MKTKQKNEVGTVPPIVEQPPLYFKVEVTKNNTSKIILCKPIFIIVPSPIRKKESFNYC